MENSGECPLTPPQENARPSLDFRLRQKLRALNETHQAAVKNVNRVNEEIRAISEEITALPRKKEQVEKSQNELNREGARLEAEMEKTEQEIANWRSKETDSIDTRRALRKEILTEICQEDEKEIVEDTLDVKTAEIQRQINKLLEGQQARAQKQIEISNQLFDLEKLITPETLAAAKEKLQTRLNEKLEELKILANTRDVACQTLHECQKLLDDLQERQTLEIYARKNGLVLKGNTTTELIQVCRAHQEKIAAKNAAVDSDNPGLFDRRPEGSKGGQGAEERISSESENDSEELCTSEACDCSHCRDWSTTKSLDSVRYFRVQEAARRHDGLTVAGAINTKQRRQTRQEHGENGWCKHW